MSNPDLQSILALEVPLIVRLGDRRMSVNEVLDLAPGRIVELDKSSEAMLEVYVNNRRIGEGTALKVGENFGVNIVSVEALHERIEALGSSGPARVSLPSADDGPSDAEAEAMAAAFLGETGGDDAASESEDAES
ncbi:MAG: FliM/FliN family flagellar motor C-terminal domain-containing protein [Planctomycetota bacterium]